MPLHEMTKGSYSVFNTDVALLKSALGDLKDFHGV